MKTLQKPNVYDFRDLSEYLKAVYKYRKHSEASFSYETWAQEMGIKSRSYLRYLVLGEKPPTHSIIPELIQGLKLDSDESSYLLLLCNYQIASTAAMRALYLKEIYGRWSRRLQEVAIENMSEFLSDPLVPQLFTYLSFEDSSSDIEKWAQDFNCDRDRMQNALKCLVWQKLVEGTVTENGGIVYRTTNAFFKIPSSPGNAHLKSFHDEGIKQAQKAVHGPTENRKLYSAFMALSADQYQKAQELIQDFNSQLIAIFNDKSIEGKKVYRLNQQLLSVSEVVSSDKAEL